LLLTGDMIDAAEAHRIGLVNRIVPAASLLDEAKALAVKLAAKAPVASRYILDAVAAGLDMSFAEAEAHEAALFGIMFGTDDMREGTSAFLEKRKAAFKGR
jgi:enoyl-CoA hydratase